ncbi:MAG: alpha/beta hydrolase [Clostridia bacterium]|nr:alpha/beta hydrolase [Clostridia bacterium]
MQYEKIELIPGRSEVTLEYFGNDDRTVPADAMLVIPGGGYWVVCSDREGYPIAQAYMMHEMNTFVLHYSVNDKIERETDPLYQASLAMIHIRKNAEKYNINPDRVFVVGFSAGGHLAGSLATLWNRGDIQEMLGENAGKNRPTGAVLCYPVTLGNSPAGHMGSFQNLLKDKFDDPAVRDAFSLEKNVGPHTCPAFILHTFDDEVVPLDNALELGKAYKAAGIPFEMHIYPHAPHGVALANKVTWVGNPDYLNPAIARWVSDSVVWMKSL